VPTGSNLDVRELPIAFGASGYLIRYQILRSEVRVLRIWHARENWRTLSNIRSRVPSPGTFRRRDRSAGATC
jgi:hypothetical protein